MDVKVFFAVLAAGAILLLVAVIWLRLDRWNQGLALVSTQLYRDLQLPIAADDSPEAKRAVLNIARARGSEIQRSTDAVVKYLDHKPFGLPLNSEQRNLRAECVSIRSEGQ